MITLAGAMSTAEIGKSLAPAIRKQRIHAICCTGANLEEDLFGLIARSQYERVENWRQQSSEEDAELAKRGLNRVTDVAIPETVIETVGGKILELWEEAEAVGDSRFPHEYLYDILLHGKLDFSGKPEDSWLMAAADANLPIFTPGWEDSTLGNIFAARVIDGSVGVNAILGGTHYMLKLAEWFRENSDNGFLQVGGGIAGDFPICVVPMLRQDLGENVPLWSWFAQISESRPSYGGYNGAPQNEKIRCEKLGVETTKFVIQSHATNVLTLLLSCLLDE